MLSDPDALMRIKNLELRAKAVVEGFLTGLHRSPYHGFSVEFSEYRQYSPGDDPRYLDWRLFARSDRYYIKRFEDETNLRCWLLVDLSRSMGFGSGTSENTKAEYAKTAAATMAYFMTLQRDAVGMMTFDETIREFLPARFRTGHMRRLMLGLENSLGGKNTDLITPIEQMADLVTKRGLVVLISDVLTPVEPLRQSLSYLRSRGHEVVLLRVLDPSETEFSFRDPVMFHDLETGREIYVDPDAVRESYLKNFHEHAAALQQICDTLGIDLISVSTAQPLEYVLFDFLNMRMRRSRSAGSRSANLNAGGPTA